MVLRGCSECQLVFPKSCQACRRRRQIRLMHQARCQQGETGVPWLANLSMSISASSSSSSSLSRTARLTVCELRAIPSGLWFDRRLDMTLRTIRNKCYRIAALVDVISRIETRNRRKGFTSRAHGSFSFTCLPKRDKELFMASVTNKRDFCRIHRATQLSTVKAIRFEKIHDLQNSLISYWSND